MSQRAWRPLSGSPPHPITLLRIFWRTKKHWYLQKALETSADFFLILVYFVVGGCKQRAKLEKSVNNKTMCMLYAISVGSVKDGWKVGGGKCRVETGAHLSTGHGVKTSDDGASSETLGLGGVGGRGDSCLCQSFLSFRSRAERKTLLHTQTDGSP